MNIEQQRTSGRLLRQLPANKIKETTTIFTRSRHVNKNSKSSPNRSEKITGENQRQSPSRRLQTDPVDLDTNRSLSSCPTYSSLSRQTPETRECATQITTLTPTEIVDDNQEISDDSPIPIDDQPVFLLDETELMPLSNGFSGLPSNYQATNSKRMILPKTESRDPQFRTKQQREKYQNELNNNSNTKTKNQLRPTAVRQLPPPQPAAVKRSPPKDTLPMTTKRNNSNSKVPKNDSVSNGFRRGPIKERVVSSPPPPPVERKRVEPTRKNGVANSPPKYLSTPDSQQDLGRKPVRVLYKHNNAYYPSPTSSVIYQKPAPVPQEISEKPRLVRVANNDYVIERRRQPAPDYAQDDYHRDSFIERPRPKRIVRLVRDAPYRDDDDDVYYVDSTPTRRIPVVQKPPPPPPAGYVYVDDAPAQIRHRRAPPPPARRPEVYYVDDGQPIDHDDGYTYVDEDGNEVEVVDERNHTPEYVQYIYDDEKDARRSHKQKVIYVDDDGTNNHVREKIKPKQPSSTRVVYE